MSSETTFHSTKEALSTLLRDIGDGKIQLPDFQRGWIWDDDHIKELLVSVTLSYPIGSVMLLATDNSQMRFQPRVVEGVDLQRQHELSQLILDGQQRLTSLYQALYSKDAVKTQDDRGKPITLWYYIDLRKLLVSEVDHEDVIVAVPEDRMQRNFRREVVADYSTQEKECANELFPLILVYDPVELLNWQMQYLKTDPLIVSERMARWNVLVQDFIQPIQQYQVPLIQLGSNTPKEAVCQIFEKVNTGGVALNVFELLTATYAVDGYKLRNDWDTRRKYLRSHKARVLRAIQNTDFLQAVTLLATYTHKKEGMSQAISCKRKDILRLPLDDYRRFADLAMYGFEEAAKFLFQQYIFSERDLPYRTQLVPLAVIFALLGKTAFIGGVLDKLKRWYWCGVFGELYGSAVETQFARDVPEVLEWVDDGPIPSINERATFTPGRLQTLQTRNSAAYKGLYALLLHEGVRDFRSNITIDAMTFFDDKIEIHHIFPQVWCRQHGIEPRRCDSIINKTAIAARTNRIISGNAPSMYVPRLQNPSTGPKMDDQAMDSILRAHAIEPRCLRADDFKGFFAAREAALLKLIENAIGKPIVRAVVEDETIQDNVQEVQDFQEEELEAVV